MDDNKLMIYLISRIIFLTSNHNKIIIWVTINRSFEKKNFNLKQTLTCWYPSN